MRSCWALTMESGAVIVLAGNCVTLLMVFVLGRQQRVMWDGWSGRQDVMIPLNHSRSAGRHLRLCGVVEWLAIIVTNHSQIMELISEGNVLPI